MNNHEILKSILINNSESKYWSEAVKEWNIIGYDEDSECISQCVCGKEHIRYLYKIKNDINKNVIYPIGSRCIKRFERTDLIEKTFCYEKSIRIYKAVKSYEYIELSSDLFSRKLLKSFYEEGAFESDFYLYSAEENYNFMLKMFNKKSAPSPKEQRRIDALIINNIKPFIKKKYQL